MAHASDYGFTEEHEMIRDTVRKFATDEVEGGAIDRDGSNEYPTSVVEQMSEIVLFGIPISEELGGAGLDHLSYAVAIEELARVDGSVAMILASHVSFGLLPIVEHGTDAQKEAWVGRLAAGECGVALASPTPFAEPRATGLPLTARPDGDGFVLEGGPLSVASAGRCGVYLVPAETDGAITVFLVEADADGIECGDPERMLGARSSDTRPVTFRGVRVSAGSVLGSVGAGADVLQTAATYGRLALTAISVGLAQGALDKAAPYSSERHAFDKPLHSFDAIAHKIADMQTETHAGRLLLHHASRLADAGKPFATEARMARSFSAGAAIRATDSAIQILGGYGYSREYHVERYYREAQVIALSATTPDHERRGIATVAVSD